MPLAAEYFQMRAIARGLQRIADKIENLVLSLLHPRHIFFQALILSVTAGFGAVEKKQ